VTENLPFWWFRANGWKFFAYWSASLWFAVPPINKLMKYNLCSLNSNELFCAISISLLDTAHLEETRRYNRTWHKINYNYQPPISRTIWLLPELLWAYTEHRQWQDPSRIPELLKAHNDGTSGAAVHVHLCKVQHALGGKRDWIRHNVR